MYNLGQKLLKYSINDIRSLPLYPLYHPFPLLNLINYSLRLKERDTHRKLPGKFG